MHRTHAVSATSALVVLFTAAVARAEVSADTAPPTTTLRDARSEAPIVAYTYSARGAPSASIGAFAYGLGLVGSGQRATAGGGVTAWAAPVDRVTLVGDALRDVYLLDHFAPSVAVVLRLAGERTSGWSIAALGKYKVEGFGTDKNGDTESEAEGGLLVSYARGRLHLDANAITGFGLTEDGEIDVEGRARAGYDLSTLVRVGADGQGRFRAAGANLLAGHRTWDFAGGPQIVVGGEHAFGSLTAGPATMGLTTAGAVGWTGVVSVGGTI
jgi:hypothetical protein